ncbi:histone-like nucleoid-structuring protein, MvaT/MvaU family [Pseudomonas coleopterorum]|uniref:histone-like nucleoid-structuring protein, MvaT/MvaU family n=1 Tax=Pseudomonas coleopterorum TaxID=1605838 RepID=UPI0017815A6C|nr:histone-like nucleoid-structuring protein, MvaT/MvaU family [Pseudomonas coleopterorum]MBD8480358.1 DNA binding protein [Pseudomonas coleopterorum]
MSRLTEYRRLEQQITEQRSRLDELRSDPRLEKEMEFEGKLHELLYPHGKGLDDMVDRLDPRFSRVQGGQVAVPAKRSRQARRVKVYRNPLTGEIVESKGGNNRLLAAWKAQFVHQEVESWVQELSHRMGLGGVYLYSMRQVATSPVVFTGLRPDVFLSPRL